MCRTRHLPYLYTSVPRGVRPAPETHPVVVQIVEGVDKLVQNRRRNLVSCVDSAKPKPRRQPKKPPPPVHTVGPRSSRRIATRRKGDEVLILAVPLEVMLEIGKYAHPQDLYALALTCTQLNYMLTSKSTQFLWKAALDNVIFPNPSRYIVPTKPEFMNELQYVDFLFGKHCMACGGVRGCVTFWTFYVRLCSRCQPLNMATVPQLIDFIRSKSPGMGEARARELVHAIPSSDHLYRRPLVLFDAKDSTVLRMRDEAELIITSLLKLVGKKTRAKPQQGPRNVVAAVSFIAYRRIRNGEVFYLALTPPKTTNMKLTAN